MAVAPGVGFGEYGEGYVRLGLVENRIQQAARGVKQVLQHAASCWRSTMPSRTRRHERDRLRFRRAAPRPDDGGAGPQDPELDRTAVITLDLEFVPVEEGASPADPEGADELAIWRARSKRPGRADRGDSARYPVQRQK